MRRHVARAAALAALFIAAAATCASAQALTWARQAGGPNFDQGFAVATDDAGNSWVTGIFTGSATFGRGETNETTLTTDIRDVFVAKYDATGALDWVKQARGADPTGGQPTAISIDAAGNGYVTGFFRFAITFDDGTTLSEFGPGVTDLFVAKYDTNGNFIWARQGGVNFIPGANGGNAAYGISADANGSSHVTGFVGTATGAAAIFIAKYDVNGALVWVKDADSAVGPGAAGVGISVDGAGNSFVTGYAAGSSPAGDVAVNGSFEDPAIPPNSFQVFQSITGWTQSSGFTGIELQNHRTGSPFDGNQFVELDGFTPIGISQNVPTQPGRSYELRFAFSPRPGTAEADNILRVSWGGEEVAVLSADGSTLSETGWTIHTYTLTGGSGSSTTLTFEDLGASNTLGTYVDAVSVVDLSASTPAGLFLAKFDGEGTLQWVRRVAGYTRSEAVSIGDDGNPRIAGSLSGTAVFGTGEPTETTLTSTNVIGNAFVATYDSNGSLVWAKQSTGQGVAGVQSIAIDATGNAHVTGTFGGVSVFGAGEAHETTLESVAIFGEAFFASFDVNGALMWATQTHGPYLATGRGIGVDAAGNSYATGTFGNVGGNAGDPTSVVFGLGEPNETTLTTGISSGTELFVARFANGHANHAPIAEDQTVSTPQDVPVAITLSASDVDGDPLTFSIVDPPIRGTLTGTPPEVTYTPLANFVGPDSFTFRAFDGTAFSQTARVSLSVEAVDIQCGALVSGMIGVAQADTFAFAGTAGQIVTLALASTGGFSSNPTASNSAMLTLFSPSGASLGVIRSNSLTNFTLPSTGRYLIRVRATNFAATGTYNFSLHCLLPIPEPGTQSLPCGSLRAATMTAAAEVDLYAFSGQAGQIISLAIASTGGFSSNPTASNSATLTLFAPSGTALGTIRSNSLANFTLPTTGIYVVRVSATNLATVGSYNVSRQCLLPVPSPAPPLQCGAVQPGTVTAAAEVDLYSFSGQAGRIISLAIASTGGFSSNPTASNSATLTLFAPSGTALGTIRSNSLANFTLPTTGTYVVRVSATNLAQAGSYNVSLQCLLPVPSPAPPLQCGAVQPGTLTAAAEADLYSFSGQAGRIVSLAIASTGGFSSNPTASNSATLTLFAPSGTALGTIRSNSLANFTLPAAGTYVIRVSATNLAQAGSYNLNLSCLLPVPTPAATLVCGAVQQGSLTAPTDMDLYAFTAQTSQIITLQFGSTGGFSTNPTASNSATVTLFAPSGMAVGTIRSNSQTNFTLPTAGIYVLGVRATNLATIGSYGLRALCPI